MMNEWSMCVFTHCPAPRANVPSCTGLFRSVTSPASHCLLPVLATTYVTATGSMLVQYLILLKLKTKTRKAKSNFCSTVLPFILFSVLHFGCCSPFIPHTFQSHLFQVSASKGTGDKNCVLRSAAIGANQSRFLLGASGGARSLVAALWCCWDATPDVTQTPVGAQGSRCDVATVYRSKQTVYHSRSIGPDERCLVSAAVNV